MQSIKLVTKAFSPRERTLFFSVLGVFLASLIGIVVITVKERSVLVPVRGGSYTEGMIGQPIMVNPVLSGNQTDQDIAALIFSSITDLASDIKRSEDGRKYSVKLKEGLVWDDGKPLTSEDVIFTVHTIQNIAAHSPLMKDWQGVGLERVSQLQIDFLLPTPYVFFDRNLARTRVIPKHIFEPIPVENIALSGYNLEPVGSGPYTFERFMKRKDGFITEYHLVPNPSYAGTEPYIERFSFRFYSTIEELAKEFRLRRIDGFGSALPLSMEIQNLPRVFVEAAAMPRYYAVFMNAVNNPALKEKNLRIALSLAIDREKIVREVFKNNALAISSPVFTQVPAGTGQSDAEQAARLIASLKSKDIKLNLVIPEIPFLQKTADVIKEGWLSAGIQEVNIFPMSANTIANEAIKTRNYELLLFGNIYENPDDLFPFWHSSQRFYPGLNLSLYQNTEADKQMETIRQKDDEATKAAALSRLGTVLSNDAPAAFLFSAPYFYAHTTRLSGFGTPFVVAASDRFQNVSSWYVMSARALAPGE